MPDTEFDVPRSVVSFYLSLLRWTATAAYDVVDKILTSIAFVIFVVALFSKELAHHLETNWQGLSRWYSIIPLSMLVLYRVLNVNYAHFKELANELDSLKGPVSFVAGHSATEQISREGFPIVLHRIGITNESPIVAKSCQLVIRKVSLNIPGLSMDTPLNIKDADVRTGDIKRNATSHFDLFLTYHKAKKTESPHGTYVIAPNMPSIPWREQEETGEFGLKLQGDNFDPKFWSVVVRLNSGLVEITDVKPTLKD